MMAWPTVKPAGLLGVIVPLGPDPVAVASGNCVGRAVSVTVMALPLAALKTSLLPDNVCCRVCGTLSNGGWLVGAAMTVSNPSTGSGLPVGWPFPAAFDGGGV